MRERCNTRAHGNAEPDLLALAYSAVGDKKALERLQRSSRPWLTGAIAPMLTRLPEKAVDRHD